MKEMTQEKMIHVALCFSDTNGEYSRYVLAVIAQAISHTKNPIMFHLVHDQTLKKTRQNALQSYIDTHGAVVKFYDISKEPEFTQMNNGMLYRLFLPRLLSSLERIIYLDGDVFIMKDLSQLWNIVLDNCSLAAVPDIKETQHFIRTQRYYRKQKLDADRYFNSGVLLMNLKYIRQHVDLIAEYLSYIHKFPHALMLDQDFLNYLFQNSTHLLPVSYNFISYDLSNLTEDIAKKQIIVHLAGRYKAWDCRNPFVIAYFSRYYAENFSSETRMEGLCNYMSTLPMRHFNKMCLNYALMEMEKNDKSGKMLSLKCILKGLLNDKGYKKAADCMTYIRHYFLYSFYYCYIRK